MRRLHIAKHCMDCETAPTGKDCYGLQRFRGLFVGQIRTAKIACTNGKDHRSRKCCCRCLMLMNYVALAAAVTYTCSVFVHMLHTHVLSHNKRLGTASRNLEVARRVGQYCKTQASRNNVSRHARHWRLGTIFQETNTDRVLTSRPCIDITECKERPAATAWTAKESLCLGYLYTFAPMDQWCRAFSWCGKDEPDK